MPLSPDYLDVNFGAAILGPGDLWLTRQILLRPMAMADDLAWKAKRRVVRPRQRPWDIDFPQISVRVTFMDWGWNAGYQLEHYPY